MSLNIAARVQGGPLRLPLLAVLSVLGAAGAGVLLTYLLLEPPANELREVAAYLTAAGCGTLAAGWLALQAIERTVGASIRTRMFLTAVLGGLLGLVNVLILAKLMFISDDHDLPFLLAVVVFGAIVTTIFALWAASNLSARLGQVTTGIRCLAGGDHAVELDTAGNDEASRLAADVNELSRRLREADAARAALDRERKELTAAISHDLRTPLASIRAMTEALADGLVEDGQQARYHAGIRREVGRLDRMLDDLFDLARSDAGALELHRQVLPLQEVVADVVDAMQPQALERGVALSLASEGEPPPLAFDPSRIERVLANLVRNALEHTACGGSVSVVVRGCPTGAEVEVTDDGEGIDPADLPRIWERFYRGEKSRNRGGRADGAGLGLASVRAVVEAHGGAVAASSSPGRGSTFSIRLPA